MKRAYVACFGCVTAVGVLVACKGGGNSGGSGGTGGATSTTVGSTTTGMGSTTTSVVSTTTTGTGMTGTSSSTGSALMCTGTQPYTNITKGTCDLLNQDCMGNMTCAPTDNGTGGTTTSCAITAGLSPPGSTCMQDTSCVKGSLCISNVCSQVCCPGTMQPCGSGACDIQVTLNGTMDFIFVCDYAPACKLFMPMACATGTQCHPAAAGLATCVSPSGTMVAEGQPCQHVNDCGDMEGCFAPQGSTNFVCRYLCQVGSMAAAGAGGCPASETCQGDSSLGFDSGSTMVGICSP